MWCGGVFEVRRGSRVFQDSDIEGERGRDAEGFGRGEDVLCFLHRQADYLCFFSLFPFLFSFVHLPATTPCRNELNSWSVAHVPWLITPSNRRTELPELLFFSLYFSSNPASFGIPGPCPLILHLADSRDCVG